ncbi:unnamed protein product [Soboliphyme baturini]|uniref:Lipoprotein n=1 Tax=Soboliphyme baturini TaxID=241478 RepID=A0A183IXH8_9BILA|nr:unnamed protein product [Soboliphyme baturini]
MTGVVYCSVASAFYNPYYYARSQVMPYGMVVSNPGLEDEYQEMAKRYLSRHDSGSKSRRYFDKLEGVLPSTP